jgi:transcriptional regulator with XRE-family HTH domain
MAMSNKLPAEQPGEEVKEMSPHSTYRSAQGAGKVVPLHRRMPPAPDARRHDRPLVQSVEPGQCIQRAYYLEARKGFASDAALAEAMGVHRSQVTRWAQGRSAHAENAWLLRDLAAAVSRLADLYQTGTINRWLFAANPDLDGEQPIQLLRQGRLPEVLMAIQAQASGAFG